MAHLGDDLQMPSAQRQRRRRVTPALPGLPPHYMVLGPREPCPSSRLPDSRPESSLRHDNRAHFSPQVMSDSAEITHHEDATARQKTQRQATSRYADSAKENVPPNHQAASRFATSHRGSSTDRPPSGLTLPRSDLVTARSSASGSVEQTRASNGGSTASKNPKGVQLPPLTPRPPR